MRMKVFVRNLCAVVMFAVAVAAGTSSLSMGSSELEAVSGECGACYESGGCGKVYIVEPPGEPAQQTWCDGSVVGDVWWCIDQENEVTDCIGCIEEDPDDCGQYILRNMETGEADETGINCHACYDPEVEGICL